MVTQENTKNDIILFLQNLQNEIIAAFEEIEGKERFQKTPWEHHGGGGGTMAHLRGSVFEKAAVNFSTVSGEHFPGDDASGPFFATGVSLITHMHNPHAPTVHMNVRYIETPTEIWFGGGYDLTPMGLPYPEDRDHFHKTAKQALDPIDPTLYPTFSKNAAEYFYIPHRNKERGVGGIFFDHYDNRAVWEAVAHSFLPAILPIYRRRVDTPFTPADKQTQLRYRGHYVEFNLLYDRGTKFGFLSKGNPEAILSSMPPLCSW